MTRFDYISDQLLRRRNFGPAIVNDIMKDKRKATLLYLDIVNGNLLSLRCAQHFLEEILGRLPYESRISAHFNNGRLAGIKLGRSPFIYKSSLINAVQSGIFN